MAIFAVIDYTLKTQLYGRFTRQVLQNMYGLFLSCAKYVWAFSKFCEISSVKLSYTVHIADLYNKKSQVVSQNLKKAHTYFAELKKSPYTFCRT